MNNYIRNVKYGITAGGMACGPVEGNVVGCVEYEDFDKIYWLYLVEVFGFPEFYLSEEDVFDKIIEMKEEDIDQLQKLSINRFNGIILDASYEELKEQLNDDLFDENDRALIKLLISIVRLGNKEADELAERSWGKFALEVDMPNLDDLI